MKVTMRNYPPPEGNIHIVRGGLGHWLAQGGRTGCRQPWTWGSWSLWQGMMRAVKKLAPLRCPKLHMTRPQGEYKSTPTRNTCRASLAECFLSSAATAADPAVRPASEIKVGLSGDTTVRSKAAGLPQSQLEARMSAGRVFRSSCPSPLPASALALMQFSYIFYYPHHFCTQAHLCNKYFTCNVNGRE